jgi:bifunctional ADP-heptose synthase (sugar kinase/adenylyltransferase)
MDQLMMQQDIDLDGVVVDGRIFTPTYIKPMMEETGGAVHELNRMDVKNRQGVLPDLEAKLIEQLESLTFDADAILVTDQVHEPGCGVVTNGLRIALSQLARSQPELPIWVDSRERGMFFLDVSLKTNLSEARKVLGVLEGDYISAEEAAIELCLKNQRPVLITAGENGIAYSMGVENGIVPAIEVEPPIDIVGAGDSVLAAAGSAIAAGATLKEAALIGCLAASVTIKKLGTTGTASVAEMLENLTRFEAQNPDFRIE